MNTTVVPQPIAPRLECLPPSPVVTHGLTVTTKETLPPPEPIAALSVSPLNSSSTVESNKENDQPTPMVTPTPPVVQTFTIEEVPLPSSLNLVLYQKHFIPSRVYTYAISLKGLTLKLASLQESEGPWQAVVVEVMPKYASSPVKPGDVLKSIQSIEAMVDKSFHGISCFFRHHQAGDPLQEYIQVERVISPEDQAFLESAALTNPPPDFLLPKDEKESIANDDSSSDEDERVVSDGDDTPSFDDPAYLYF